MKFKINGKMEGKAEKKETSIEIYFTPTKYRYKQEHHTHLNVSARTNESILSS